MSVQSTLLAPRQPVLPLRRVDLGGTPPLGSVQPCVPPPNVGRIFPDLPPFAENSTALRRALLAVGAEGGPLDALSRRNSENPRSLASIAVLAQFVEHDLTFDAFDSPDGTARFDLDGMYGRGPTMQPHLYDPGNPVKLRGAFGGEALQRLADTRNGANPVISTLHAAFCRFHNNVVDLVSIRGKGATEVFHDARRLTTWHYQWLIVNRLLPQLVGAELVDDVLSRGTRFFHPYTEPYLPLEFSDAAYAVWQHLPYAQRTLLRQLDLALPSGQRIAREMGIEPLRAADLADVGAYGQRLDTSTPLWLYVMREAEVVNAGRFLGPVGGRIVAETMIGLLRAHPDSYLFTRPSFSPMLGARPGAEYEISDFLRFARVDPDSRG